MAIGYWVLIGAGLGAAFGGAVGAGSVLIGYHYPYNPHYDIYPLPVAIGNVGGADAVMCIIPGAVIGSFIGTMVRAAQARRRREVPPESVSDPEVWPPPPTV